MDVFRSDGMVFKAKISVRAEKDVASFDRIFSTHLLTHFANDALTRTNWVSLLFNHEQTACSRKGRLRRPPIPEQEKTACHAR